MIERIVRACSNPGEVVLDCFGGSGTTAVAAKQNSRGFISIERDPVFHQAAIARLSAASRRRI
jgi:DNA modification methylase